MTLSDDQDRNDPTRNLYLVSGRCPRGYNTCQEQRPDQIQQKGHDMPASTTIPTPEALLHVDELRLEEDLQYRFEYVAQFIGFGVKDIKVLCEVSELLSPHIAGLVDAVYEKLFQYDATKRHFVPRNCGFDGKVPESLESLTLDDEQITFRKTHLRRYLEKLLTVDYDVTLVTYLDFVGRTHTTKAGATSINVPLVQMNALMGFVATALSAKIMDLGLDGETQRHTLQAVTKLLWIQNDLITRHYNQ